MLSLLVGQKSSQMEGFRMRRKPGQNIVVESFGLSEPAGLMMGHGFDEGTVDFRRQAWPFRPFSVWGLLSPAGGSIHGPLAGLASSFPMEKGMSDRPEK
jgi:hypothetical protein